MNEQHMQVSTIVMLGEALKRPEGEAQVRKALQAAIEGVLPGESSLDGKLVDVGGNVKFPERDFTFAGIIDGVPMKRHRNGGGLVPVDQDRNRPSKAFVAEDVYVGPQVIVWRTAKLFGGEFRGGVFSGGEFRGGVFSGGEFRGGVFSGGVFRGGVFSGGEFLYGQFHGGEFYGGEFHRGRFYSGKFSGGLFYGGEFYGGEFSRKGAIYDRVARTYRSHYDADNVTRRP